MPGAVLKRQARLFVQNLLEYFEMERDNGGPFEALASVQEISSLAIVYSRPQDQQPTYIKDADPDPSVEIERQVITKVIPTDVDPELSSNANQFSNGKMEASTRQILEKIAEVNKNQGLVHKKQKPNYFHFPLGYSRSQENLKLSRDPFDNPVQEYLKNYQQHNDNLNQVPSLKTSNLNSANSPDNNIFSVTDTQAKIELEDHIPGQYIKRKITHYQGFIFPNPYMLDLYNLASPNLSPLGESTREPIVMNSVHSTPYNPSNFPPQQFGYSTYPTQNLLHSQDITASEKNKTSSSEKETVNNIKSIVTRTNENLQNAYFPSVYYPSLPPIYQNFLAGSNYDHQNTNSHIVPYVSSNNVQSSDVFSRNFAGEQPANLNNQGVLINYAASVLQQPSRARQNWNWPGANIFPIYIRDPFLQMYYAVTNMIEYGPNSGSEGPCKLTPRPQGSKIKVNSKISSNKDEKSQKVDLKINKHIRADDADIITLNDNYQAENMLSLYDDDIDMGGNELAKLSINFPKASFSESRDLKDDVKSKMTRADTFSNLHNNSTLFQLVSGNLDFKSNSIDTNPHSVNSQLTPIRDQVLHIEEIDDEPLESEKAEDINISNQGTKKVFSRENTGSGIFIHKLKVRYGGVAIAGPGGIATAGSGGTAIVGPNGVAYTHPNGLAIAGSGTKVVAVDPDIDLNEVIKESVINGTRYIPNTRVGKVVAIGPVVYYNKG